jgi:hypothetical protein
MDKQFVCQPREQAITHQQHASNLSGKKKTPEQPRGAWRRISPTSPVSEPTENTHIPLGAARTASSRLRNTTSVTGGSSALVFSDHCCRDMLEVVRVDCQVGTRRIRVRSLRSLRFNQKHPTFSQGWQGSLSFWHLLSTFCLPSVSLPLLCVLEATLVWSLCGAKKNKQVTSRFFLDT